MYTSSFLVSNISLAQVEKLMKEDESKREKRSIGIISLWEEGNKDESSSKATQSKRIDALLDENEYIRKGKSEHGIRCGDARAFQGDEKDIILLSLVIGSERRKAMMDPSMFNVAVSRARYSIVLFHSVELSHLKEADLRYSLLKYFKDQLNPAKADLFDVWGVLETEESALLAENVTAKLVREGYTAKSINAPSALMIELGSKSSDKSCIFVVLGQGDSDKWRQEQEICYMLSRLDPGQSQTASNRSWKAIWLFDAILRPDQCLQQMKRFLKDKNVTPLLPTEDDREGSSSALKLSADEVRLDTFSELSTYLNDLSPFHSTLLHHYLLRNFCWGVFLLSIL